MEEAFDLALAPGVVRLGVEQADAQVGADDAGVVVDERTALVGVELAGHTPAANSFLEAAMEAARVGPQIIRGVGQHPRMVVNDGAQVRGRGLLLAGQMEEGTRGKVHHPQLIDQRRFKRFGGPADGLTHEIMTRALVQVMTLERTVDGAQRRQERVLLLPLPVEHFDGNGRMGSDLRDDEPFLLRGELARDPAVGAAFGMQARQSRRAHRHTTSLRACAGPPDEANPADRPAPKTRRPSPGRL